MNIQDIYDIGADGPRAYAPFTPAQLQDAHDRAMEEQEPEEKPNRDEEEERAKRMEEKIAGAMAGSWAMIAREMSRTDDTVDWDEWKEDMKVANS